MQSRTQSIVSRTEPVRRIGLPAALLLGCGTASFAGLINPGGDAFIWSGAVNDNWHVGGNWTGGAVPGADDSVIIDSGPSNVYLQANSANLDTLYVAGARALSNNGFALEATMSTGETEITGLDSRIFVVPIPGNGIGFETNTLFVDNDARLFMSSGRTRINDQLTLMDDARIVGRGEIEVNSASPAAFNGLNGLSINATGGDVLSIEVNGGGSIAYPPTLNIVDPGSTLAVDAPQFLPAMDMNLGEDCEADFAQAWTIAGTLEADPGIGNEARISGAEMTVEGDVDVASGALRMQGPVSLTTGSSLSVFSTAFGVIEEDHDADAGSVTNVGFGGTLRIDGAQAPATPWSGAIELAAGELEVNDPQPGVWRMDGPFEMGSLFGIRSRVSGTALMRLLGDVSLPGVGGIIDNHTQLWTGATMDVVQASTSLIVNGRLTAWAGSHIFGAGSIDVAENGEFVLYEPVNVDVDVNNAGEMEVEGDGALVGYVYIDGDYTQTATGQLVVEMAGFAPLQRDVYETSGSATLSGELFVNLIGGYEPMIGDSFVVLTANGGLSGTFDSLTGDPGFTVSYPGNTVVLNYVGLDPCPGDLNGDGVVGAADIAELLSYWGGPSIADINGDGDTNALDLAILLGFWGPCA